MNLFRVNKFICAELILKLRPALEARTCRRNVFSVETKFSVLCDSLPRVHTRNAWQMTFATVCRSKASVTIRSVTDAINTLMFEDYIKFPVVESEIEMIKREFYHYSNFPGVIGAIDCSHVAIIAPPDDDYHIERNYVNRKGFHSLNVQLVSDMRMKIISICACFPGCTHDSYIWKMSRLRDWFVANSAFLQNTWLLGDSGYPLEPWLMTPLEPARTAEENNYNASHKLARCVIERCNGALKSRFRCLSKFRALNYSPTAAGMIINACAVLHNMCIDHDLIIEQDIDQDDEPFNSGVPESHR